MPPEMTISPTREELEKECEEYVRVHPDEFAIENETEALIATMLYEKLGIVIRKYELSDRGKMEPMWREVRRH